MGGSESKANETDRSENDDKGNETDPGQMKTEAGSGVALAVGAAVGTALLAWGVSRILSDSESNKDEKIMKPPGRPGEPIILRKPFEDNPGEYFRILHKERKANR